MEIILINKASGVSLRDLPRIDSNLVASLSKNEKAKFLEFDGSKKWVKIVRGNGAVGWSAYKFFTAVNVESGFPDDPKWLDIAYGEYGVTENLEKGKSNPRIEEYLNSCNHSTGLKDDTAWCSAFTNWCVEKAGYEGANSLWAQDWYNWGQKVEEPFRGCITVFKRYVLNNKTKKIDVMGHVGFFLGKNSDGSVDILSGNASNQVIVKSFPTNCSTPPKSGEYKLMGYCKPLS